MGNVQSGPVLLESRGLDNWIPTIVGIVGNSYQRFLHTGQYIEQLKQDIVNGMAQTTCDSSWMCTAGLPNQYKIPGKIQKRTMVKTGVKFQSKYFFRNHFRLYF